MGKVPPPLLIVLDDTWDTKGRNGHDRVSQPGSGNDNFFPQLNYASIIMEYNQRLQSYFGGQTWGLYNLIKNTAKMMCYCYETIIIGHTEESSLSRKTQI